MEIRKIRDNDGIYVYIGIFKGRKTRIISEDEEYKHLPFRYDYLICKDIKSIKEKNNIFLREKSSFGYQHYFINKLYI